MKLKSISWVPIIVPLALLIIIVCFIVPIIAEHRAKHELIFERIDKASNSRETYQAMLDMINSGDPLLSHPSMWAPFVMVGDVRDFQDGPPHGGVRSRISTAPEG